VFIRRLGVRDNRSRLPRELHTHSSASIQVSDPEEPEMSTAQATTSQVTYKRFSGTANAGDGDPRRWLILATICTAALMIVLDVTVMNLALPSAQRALGFTNADRQWIVTAYALSFGSLLLFCGRLADLIGRKATFLTGLAGFAVASAAGGAAGSFTMLVTARACQGVFAALLAPSALSLLTTTFTDVRERGKAFGVYGAVAASGSGLGLLLGGALTSYLSWRWCLYVNLLFAATGITGGALLLGKQPKTPGARLDIPGVAAVSGGMFCLVYGFSSAATHGWHAPSTVGFLAAGVALLIAFAAWQTRAPHPLLPPRVILDRNRGGAYLTMLITGAGIFGIFLFLVYYMQLTLGYSPVKSGVAMLPMVAVIGVMANVGNIVLMPRLGPKPLLIAGMLCNAASTAACPARADPRLHHGVLVVRGHLRGRRHHLLRPGPLAGPGDTPARGLHR
jgi:MFS family permease